MDDSDPATFGPLIAISAESLVLLASNIANRCLHLPKTTGKLVARISGSYNITHIVELENLKLVFRVPATGWGAGRTPSAARAIESQVATIRLIRSKTAIPVPEIYALDTTENNEISAPYLCMSFLPGKPVSKVWFDRPGTLPREELRLRILTNLSRTMAQFSCLTFDKMGFLLEDGSGSTIIGPLCDWDEKADGSIQVATSGPFNSTSAFLQEHLVTSPNDSIWNDAGAKVFEAILGCLPILDSLPDFVLCPPDFDSQNILVDEEGTITGLIDWDLTHTMPRFMGYARYPGWIMRDWDPLMYGWQKMADSEDSPHALGRYRAYYNAELGKALEGSGDWRFTEKSHIAEAIWIAALHQPNRLGICRKFVQIAVGDDADPLDVLYAIGAGRYGEQEWQILQGNLKRFIC